MLSKIKMNKQSVFVALLYLIGIMHWFFFFFFVDYYAYSNSSPTAGIEEVINKGSSIAQSIKDLNRTAKGDLALLKTFLTSV